MIKNKKDKSIDKKNINKNMEVEHFENVVSKLDARIRRHGESDVSGMLNKKTDGEGELKFVALGGAQGVTMSCYAYGYKDEWIIVDCGVLLDQDVTDSGKIVPDLTFLKDKNIKALILTHWHEDHFGAVPYYMEEYFSKCPIYTSPMGALKVQSSIDDQLGLNNRYKPNFIKVKPEGETLKISDNFTVQFIHSTHLTLQSFMLAIKTPEGTVLHTGDWNFTPNALLEPRTDFEALKALNKENLISIVGDSTEVYRKTENWGEDTVKEELFKVMKGYKKRIFVTLFSSSTARVDSIYRNATALGRKVCFLGLSMETNIDVARGAGYLKDCDFIPLQDAMKLPPEKVCYICTGCQGEPYAVMTMLAKDNYKNLKIEEGDAVIFSASIIPGNQKNVLYVYGKIIDKQAELYTINDNYKIHSHGHGNYNDFVHFYTDLCKPGSLIPVHGDKLSQFLHMKLARDLGIKNTFMIDNGDVIAFNKGNPQIIEKIEAGALVVEGSRTLPIGDAVFKNRTKAFYDGVVFVTLAVDKQGNLKDAPVVSSVGLFESDETGMIKRHVEIKIVDELKELTKAKQKSEHTLTQAAAAGARKALKDTGKRPRVVVHFVYK
ncbi:MAG: ribonuclease J [Rickettsiales bacterium]|jgi:ribonuclease J|nr:ribonuclease J [Rickettsiales bacterium]